MPLEPGTRLGPYEILSQIGAGGMGEVYKGRDTRLDRLVAIKTLPAHLAERPELRERFKREAHAIANLKHAHICVLYDIGSQEIEEAEEAKEAQEVSPSRDREGAVASRRRTVRVDYLVMEYLEGETLSERLKKGPLPLEQVLRYAEELADALDTAHRGDFTHRDIKPGNIMLTKEGSKLLDFGLAKMKQEMAAAITPASERPTVPGTLTEQGTLLGTLQYMAPEQVEGKVDEIDGRTDIFAFGAVVYEMATRKKAFDGQTQASVISKILQVDPPLISSLEPPGKLSPPALDRVVKRCLAKDRDQRWQTAYDLWQDVKWIKEGGGQAAMPTIAEPKPSAKVWQRAMPWAAAFLAGAIVVGLAIWALKPAPLQPVSRLTITLPPGQRLAALDQPAIAISPDGENIVYVAIQTDQSRERERPVVPSTGQPPLADARGSDAGTQQLFLRPLDSLESKPMAGTEGAVGPFFSPDGQWIGFFVGGRLKKVSVNGGAAVTLANATVPGGASWSSQGTLALQSALVAQGVQQVSQEGGTPQPLTRLEKGELLHRWPEFLPGGKGLLFAGSVTNVNWNNAQIAVETVGTGERKNLVQGATQPRYAASGHLLYAQSGTIMAAPFDERSLEVSGASIPALEGVMVASGTGAAQYSVSSTGTLVYLAGGAASSQSRLVWVSRSGEEQLLPAAPHTYQFPRVAPDGRRVAVAIAEQDTQVWVYDVSRDTLTRLTFGGNANGVLAWSADGRRIAFQSAVAGAGNLFWQSADGSGAAERLTTSDYLQSPNSFSPDGQLLALHEANPQTARDIWVLNLKDRKAQPFLRTPYEEFAPKFSPDGKWLAYGSNESGRPEIYVQPYPGPGGKWQISTDGGQEPVWNPRGGELFYRSGSKIMAVEVSQSRDREGAVASGQSPDREGGGPSAFSAGRPRMLFEGPYLPTAAASTYYDVSPDGQRFLMLKPVESQASAPTQIHVVLNWFEELKRRVPVGQ